MQQLESFTVVSDVVGTARKSNYDALNGLRIEGVSASEARLVLVALEALTKDNLVTLARGEQLTAAPVNQARWKPAAHTTPTSRTVPVGDPPPPPESDADAKGSEPANTPADATPVPTVAPDAQDAATDVSDAPAEPAPDTGAVRAQPSVTFEDVPPAEPVTPAEVAQVVNAPVAAAEEEPAEEPSEAPTEEEEKPKRRRRKSKPERETRPDDRPAERRAPLKPARGWKVGDTHEGNEVVQVSPHSDDGCLLVRADGWRIRLRKNGSEHARLQGFPPEEGEADAKPDLKTAGELAAEEKARAAAKASPEPAPPEEVKADEAPAPVVAESDTAVPDEILQTKMTRVVLQYLIDKGVKGEDDLTAACMQLKAQGAAAFKASRDETAVRRRVCSTLMVLG